MARITVEDCFERAEADGFEMNRFDLVLAAAQRTRQLDNRGLEPTLPRKREKSTVTSLREFAAGTVDPRDLDAIEKRRNEALQAAQAGVSDSFMSGNAEAFDNKASSTGSKASSFVSKQPLSEFAERVQSSPLPSTTAAKPVRKLNSAPSLFEQVANQSGPVSAPPASVDKDADVKSDDVTDPGLQQDNQGNT